MKFGKITPVGFTKKIFFVVYASLLMSLSSCYSVFSGGTGGIVVDAESTSSPKSGIANVDVYAYMSLAERDADFSKWKAGSVFAPSAEYYGHTVSGSDGSFSISRLVWKSEKPDFWKDADYTDVYLLFYNENYGLTKGQTIIISDGTSNTVYQELTAIRKTTALNFNFIDVSTGNQSTRNMYIQVKVPQTTETVTDAADKVYEATISGSGTISVSYPRWQSEQNKTDGVETKPVISITYTHSSSEIEWKGCFHADNEDKNYAFFEDGFLLKKAIMNLSYDINLYGKPTRLTMPSVGGQYINTGDAQDDGVPVLLKMKDSQGNYTIDCGQVTTASQVKGTTSEEKHGVFSGLGTGFTWIDTTYTGKFASAPVRISAGEKSLEMDIRSNSDSYTVQLGTGTGQ